MAKMGEFASMPGFLFDELVMFYTTSPNLSPAEQISGLVSLATASNAAAATDKTVDLVAVTMLCVDLRVQKDAANGAAAGSLEFTAAINNMTANLQQLAQLYK